MQCLEKRRRTFSEIIMSVRCKVCNASMIKYADSIITSDNWECQSCGNLLDGNGCIVTLN